MDGQYKYEVGYDHNDPYGDYEYSYDVEEDEEMPATKRESCRCAMEANQEKHIYGMGQRASQDQKQQTSQLFRVRFCGWIAPDHAGGSFVREEVYKVQLKTELQNTKIGKCNDVPEIPGER